MHSCAFVEQKLTYMRQIILMIVRYPMKIEYCYLKLFFTLDSLRHFPQNSVAIQRYFKIPFENLVQEQINTRGKSIFMHTFLTFNNLL